MVSRIITLLLLAALSCIVTRGNVEVNFTPSPNIAEGGTAVYNCSTNHSAVTVTWYLNKTLLLDLELASSGVTAGLGTRVFYLTIPGLVDPFNNTEVLCHASGPGFVGDVLNPPPVMLRIQGRLEAPTAVQSNDSCCYHFNWSPPFTLSGVPILGYNINITNNNGNVLQTNVSNTTQWEYCPQEFGNNNVNIAAVNGVGEGEVTTLNLLINHYSIKVIQKYRDMYQNWILIVRILEMRCSINHVLMQCIDSEVEFNSTNITSDGLVTFNISTYTTDDKNHTVTTQLSHENKVMTAMANNSLLLSFFDVSSYTILSNVNTNVSLQCTFVDGSKAHGCRIDFKKSRKRKNDTEHSVNITRENNTMEGIVLPEDGEYQIDVFDINENKSPASLPAFTSTIVIIPAPVTSITTTSQVPTPTPSATTSTGSSAGPSEVNGPKPTTNIGIIVGSIAIAIVIVIVAVLVVGIVYVCHRKSKNIKVDCKEKGINPSSHNSGHSEIHVSTRPKLPVLNYVDIEPDPDAPAVPPPYDPDKTIYSELQKETTAISQTNVADEYNTLNHNPNNTCPVDVSNAGMYSTINNGQQQLQLTGAVNSSAAYDTVPSEQESKMVPSQYSMVSKEYIQRELTHKDLSELVIPRLSLKWYEVGLALELTPDQLNDIEDNHQGISDVFQIWEDSGKKPFTWQTLLSVLRSPQVNEYELANQLQEQ